MGVLKAARDRRVAVPGELAVVRFDDLDIADYIGLTTVRQPLEESGLLCTLHCCVTGRRSQVAGGFILRHATCDKL